MLFKLRKKQDAEKAENSIMDMAAIKTAQVIKNTQTKWASWMSRKSEKLSPRGRKIALGIFLFIGTAYSLVMIFRGPVITWQARSAKSQFTSIPIGAGIDTALSHYNDSHRRAVDLDMIAADLRTNSKGKYYLDSLIKARPGITDSVDLLISLYKKQMITSSHK